MHSKIANHDKICGMQIVLAPNPVLRQAVKSVTKFTPGLKQTVGEMIKLAQSFQDPEGVGLAAPQVGIKESFFIAKIGSDFIPFFNPRIISFGKKTAKSLEGCLSIPNYYAEISRPTSIKVSFQDINGHQINKSLKGFSAMVFQHEYDHLKGVLFMDLCLKQKARLFKVVGKDPAGNEVFEEVKLIL